MLASASALGLPSFLSQKETVDTYYFHVFRYKFSQIVLKVIEVPTLDRHAEEQKKEQETLIAAARDNSKRIKLAGEVGAAAGRRIFSEEEVAARKQGQEQARQRRLNFKKNEQKKRVKGMQSRGSNYVENEKRALREMSAGGMNKSASVLGGN